MFRNSPSHHQAQQLRLQPQAGKLQVSCCQATPLTAHASTCGAVIPAYARDPKTPSPQLFGKSAKDGRALLPHLPRRLQRTENTKQIAARRIYLLTSHTNNSERLLPKTCSSNRTQHHPTKDDSLASVHRRQYITTPGNPTTASLFPLDQHFPRPRAHDPTGLARQTQPNDIPDPFCHPGLAIPPTDTETNHHSFKSLRTFRCAPDTTQSTLHNRQNDRQPHRQAQGLDFEVCCPLELLLDETNTMAATARARKTGRITSGCPPRTRGNRQRWAPSICWQISTR